MKEPAKIIHFYFLPLLLASFFAHTEAQSTLLSSTDIPYYIKAVSPVPDNLQEAMKRTYGVTKFNYDTPTTESFYRELEDEIQHIQERYLDFYGKKQESLSYSEADAKAAVEKNYIVKEMGGLEAIQNMSPEQREAAARAAAAQYMEDPFSANGIQSEGMTALYRKIMSDPDYAARFEKMSEQEKEAELRKFMANDQPKTRTTEQIQVQQQQHEMAEKVRNSQEIILKMQEWNEQIQSALDDFGAAMTAIWTSPGNHEDIDADFHRKYDQIPLVILGEGKEKDPEKEKSLRLETAARQRERAEWELQQAAPLLAKLQDRYIEITTDYMYWIRNNGDKVNGDMADYFNGTHTEIPLANFETTLLGLATNLIDHNKKYTADAAEWAWREMEIKHQYSVK